MDLRVPDYWNPGSVRRCMYIDTSTYVHMSRIVMFMMCKFLYIHMYIYITRQYLVRRGLEEWVHVCVCTYIHIYIHTHTSQVNTWWVEDLKREKISSCAGPTKPSMRREAKARTRPITWKRVCMMKQDVCMYVCMYESYDTQNEAGCMYVCIYMYMYVYDLPGLWPGCAA